MLQHCRCLSYCCHTAAVFHTAATVPLSLILLLMRYSPLLLHCCQIQYKVFRKYGLDDETIRRWFNGPALLTWSRGQVAGLPVSNSLCLIHSLSLVLVAMMKSKEFKTKICSHAQPLIHSLWLVTQSQSHSHCHSALYLLL